MLGLEDLEIGLLIWAEEDARKTINEAKQFGLRAGQLGFPGGLSLDGAAERWDEALTAERFLAVAAVCSYVGEDYADVGAVQSTVGLVPTATRRERITRTKAISDLARSLGIDSVACHIGFIPEDPESALNQELREVAREICDFCAENGQSFTLETGQEPAKTLLQFIADVGRPNLKVNFDPANMILYGTGDPIDALDLLRKHVVSVHCKDGNWPAMDQPNALGVERPLGEGDVDLARFLSKLKEIGYRGLLCIEREGAEPGKRQREIRQAIELLNRLKKPEHTAASR